MDLSGRPRFAYADHALLAQETRDGPWAGVDLDGVQATYPAEAMAGALALAVGEAGNGLYAVPDAARAGASYRFAFSPGDGCVTVETDEGAVRKVPVEAFVRSAVRVDSQGDPVCSFLQPLHEQYAACRELGLDGHVMDVAAMAEAARASGTASGGMDAWLFDAVSSGLDDGAGFMELMAKVTARGPRPVHETTALSAAFPEGWAEIREFPQYMMAPLRTLFEGYMSAIGAECGFERVSRLHLAHGAPAEAVLAGVARLVSEDAPFRGGNLMRGYSTSPVKRYEGEGFMAITFSDVAGTYVYAWRPEPAPGPAPKAGGEGGTRP